MPHSSTVGHVTYLLATFLLVAPYSSTFGIALNSDDVSKPKLTPGGAKDTPPTGDQLSYDTCSVNGRSQVVCGMCAEIFHQAVSHDAYKQYGGKNMAATECCESGDVYEVCTKTLRELMEERDDDLNPAESDQNSNEPADQQQQYDDDSSYLNDIEVSHGNDDVILDDVSDAEDKRALNPFLGKRANPFLGKRGGNPFLGKRRMNPFLGKRVMNPFLGKRAMNPFLGKRAINPFLGKRANPFLGRRAMNPFLGKRAMNPFLGKRAMNPFLGKRVMNPFLG